MSYLAAILPIVCVLGQGSFQEAEARNDVIIIEGHAAPVGPPSKSEHRTEQRQTAEEKGAPGQAPSPTPGESTSATVFRDVPSISGRYSVGRTMLMPYLGAGFGSGYASERDRSLNSPISPNADTGLRSQFGQSFAPNEFQMGIRIPF